MYLNASFSDGSERRECLGTFMPVVDSVDIDGAYREGQINAYGLLKRLKDDDFDGPYVIVAGSNLVDEAVKIAESVGLTVYADPSSLLLGSTLVFGVGRDNDAKNKLDAVDLLLKAAGFRSPATEWATCSTGATSSPPTCPSRLSSPRAGTRASCLP